MVGALREDLLKAVRAAGLLLGVEALRAVPVHPYLTLSALEWGREQEAVAQESVAAMLLPPAGPALNGGW